MSQEIPVYSIQRTYIIKPRMNAGKEIFTCDRRIDIPTIEPLSNVQPVLLDHISLTVIPCIELSGAFSSEFDLTFETNEGVTVLPIEIGDGNNYPPENPYTYSRYVLALPIGATGVKSCKLIHKATGKEVQHDFTFGIMPPPYNYDNALFGYFAYRSLINNEQLNSLNHKVYSLKLSTTTPTLEPVELPKGAGKQTINIEPHVLFYNTGFNYPTSSEPTTHKPKITLHGDGRDQIYTLSLNKTKNAVSIDLFTGMLTVYDGVTGEIIQQFKLPLPYQGFGTLSFEGFDDINDSVLRVTARGARVNA